MTLGAEVIDGLGSRGVERMAVTIAAVPGIHDCQRLAHDFEHGLSIAAWPLESIIGPLASSRCVVTADLKPFAGK